MDINKRKYHKSIGLCTHCSNPARLNHSQCEKCSQKTRDRANVKRQKRLENKQCVKCGLPALDNLTCCEKCRLIRNEESRRKNNRRKENGKCRCGKLARENRTRCEECAVKDNNDSTIKANKRKQNNICVRCKRPTDGRTLCEICRQYDSSKYNALKEKGLCTTCGKDHDSECLICNECNQKHKNNVAKYLSDKKHLCSTCNVNEPLQNCRTCETCIYKTAAGSNLNNREAWIDLKELMIKQNYKCRYLGISINIGWNAHLDHIIPVSKGGSKTLDNVQWVHQFANIMKADLDEKVFIEQLKELLPAIKNKIESL